MEKTIQAIVDRLRSIADETGYKIYLEVCKASGHGLGVYAKDVSNILNIKPNCVAYHLRKMERSGVVYRKHIGNRSLYVLNKVHIVLIGI